MTQAAADDMKFMGETTHPGGQFRDIAVVGRARMDGDVSRKKQDFALPFLQLFILAEMGRVQ